MKLKLNIPLEKIWVTSDLHLGHKNITGPSVSNWGGGYRNFDSIPEMDQEILFQINNTVAQDDYLFILGDFAYLNKVSTEYYRSQINCKNVFLIRGNHDSEKDIQKARFSGIYDYLELEVQKQLFCLFHYKLFVWNHSHKGSICLYGHSHNTAEHMEMGKSMDVGIDAIFALKGKYRPISVTEVIEIMDKREIKLIDHHNQNTN